MEVIGSNYLLTENNYTAIWAFLSAVVELFNGLAQDIAIVVTCAYLLSQTYFFRKMLNRRLGRIEQFFLSLLFGFIGIYGTYSGIPIYGALANSRVLGPVVGGLLGGPWVGLGSGLIAGAHRFWLGGFTGFACGIATVLEGVLGGWCQRWLRERPITWPVALAVGALAELMQMVVILLVARPLPQAWILVKAIGLPMIGVNSIGIATFFLIIRSVINRQDQVGAELAQRALGITRLTLPFLRNGLTMESAQKAAETIYNFSTFSAVAITNTEKILAHVGAGQDHHLPGEPILTQSSRAVLATKQFMVAKSKQEIGCKQRGCPLGVAVLAPLRQKGEVVGILKLYRHSFQGKYLLDVEFAQGLAAIFDTQMELAQLNRQKELLAKAELRALQAQINPHFLFNALNTISTFIRTKPDAARDLLHHLSDFFRRNLQGGKEVVTLTEEIIHIRDYLAIEKARFGERLQVAIDLPPDILKETVPSLILQPLVENAVRHGLAPRKEGGAVTVSGEIIHSGEGEEGEMVLTVADNGVGIAPERLQMLLAEDGMMDSRLDSGLETAVSPGWGVSTGIRPGTNSGLGIGLRNVHERLQNLYGPRFPLQVESSEGQGTRVKMRIPIGGRGNRND